ncbi:MAG TPA: MBL fold metallo-hydrolase [Mycobacteriales bacterium]|jgi:L-ascorbate metabolism protein UlaG (beta-lactamase superfamily)|nr:MBL fold metallo-hydrolase [Mycobacteriales bacterium]
MTDDSSRGDLHFVGNATTVIRYGDITVLTDPNFLHRGQHAYLGYGLWTTRRTEPALQPEDLPPIDLVVLSHLHADHWDRVATRELDPTLPILTTKPAAKRLHQRRFRSAEGLDPWERRTITRRATTLRVTALPGAHARGLIAPLLPAVIGSLLEFSGPDLPELKIYQSGDTLLVDRLEEIRQRCPDIDVGMIHLGGTRVLGMMVTMDGREGATWLKRLEPGLGVPIHYDDYTAFKSPLSDFLEEVKKQGVDVPLAVLDRGDHLRLPPG